MSVEQATVSAFLTVDSLFGAKSPDPVAQAAVFAVCGSSVGAFAPRHIGGTNAGDFAHLSCPQRPDSPPGKSRITSHSISFGSPQRTLQTLSTTASGGRARLGRLYGPARQFCDIIAHSARRSRRREHEGIAQRRRLKRVGKARQKSEKRFDAQRNKVGSGERAGRGLFGDVAGGPGDGPDDAARRNAAHGLE